MSIEVGKLIKVGHYRRGANGELLPELGPDGKQRTRRGLPVWQFVETGYRVERRPKIARSADCVYCTECGVALAQLWRSDVRTAYRWCTRNGEVQHVTSRIACLEAMVEACSEHECASEGEAIRELLRKLRHVLRGEPSETERYRAVRYDLRRLRSVLNLRGAA